MQLFLNTELDNSFKQFFFTPEESRHIVKVLRKVAGDKLEITNGRGSVFTAKILLADPKKCKAQIESEEKKIPRLYHLHLVVAPTKMNDRFEWFLEKATEIGVDQITPLLCERSERKTIKPERYERIVQSATKQSYQAFLPKLNPLTTFDEFINSEIEGLKFIAHCDEGEKLELKRCVAPDKDIVILIGPEGDFSPAEIKKAIDLGFRPVALGKNRLRTETAAIVACHTVALVNS
ncbi:MAG: 16S rRNA (uracil(1498)-N(3))-methyltransferase [Allomuricauda sp.]|nr:MAG: 16S rRNA (uracil(1498)-N(3))-methyltransferase [Allomuricauda sp.]